MTYQGSANWETWDVALWFGNDEGLYNAVREHHARFTANSAEAFVWELLPEGTPDFRGSPREVAKSYGQVDWQEIADDFNEMRGGDEPLEEARRQARGDHYEIKRGRLGWSAVLYDSRGDSINVINGDSEESVRGAAQRSWPGIKERGAPRPGPHAHEARRPSVAARPRHQRALISSQDTPKAERIIRSAAAAKFGRGRADLFFEHDQWWATVGSRTYSVVDAIPGFDGLGIDFEALG